jgi:peptidoglycan/LPS O-acetylase OafA/YrhL
VAVVEQQVLVADAPASRRLPESASKRAGASFYRPELDALRFFAFLGVFVFHATRSADLGFLGSLSPWAAAVSDSGAYGVDLFFALSAYLITALLLREKESQGTLDLKAFYLRRILRIWPLYFAFLAFALFLSRIGLQSQHLAVPYVAGYLLLTGNWVYTVYGVPSSVAIPLWSVSIEEQFYLLWPMAVRKASRQAMMWIAFSLLVVSNCVRVLLVHAGAPASAIEYNTFVRLDPIALGILLALFLGYRLPRISTLARIALFSVGAATWVVVARYAVLNGREISPASAIFGHPAIAIASLAMLVAILGSNSLLSNPALVYLGKISYGLYVIHEFGLLAAEKAMGGHMDAKSTAVGLLLTIALAAASYRWIETPFLSLKKRFTYVSSRSV